MRVAVVDYGMGNRRSVEQALLHVGAVPEVTGEAGEIARAGAVVLPGVGAFPKAMSEIERRGLAGPLREIAAAGVPLLGICLGMQLLFEGSDELGGAEGLGVLRGRVRALDPRSEGRLPHIGWNEVRFERPSPLVDGLDEAAAFYHVHSFVAAPEDRADVIGTAEHGERFASIVGAGSIAGVQFHPEKSSRAGLALLGNFVRLASRTGAASQAA